MQTKVLQADQLETIQSYIQAGKVVAFPTDTVFGVGVRFDDEQALHALKQAKQRDSHKPIPMMVQNLVQMKQVADVDWRMDVLYKHFMPGALTVVLNRKENIPSYVSDGKKTIAIRIPDDALLLELLANGPMLVTSANLSGELPGKDEQEVLAQLDGRIDAIVKGKAKANIASTIIDLTGERITLLREGVYSLAQIEAVLKEEQR
ncbi:hypothetical protein A4S06_08505 [Erysipelotrichaceae bacterium MTC7]|nr:hypothetical protein A4S06_08505 [Erysipelotrichaceae bacterium MTC7]